MYAHHLAALVPLLIGMYGCIPIPHDTGGDETGEAGDTSTPGGDTGATSGEVEAIISGEVTVEVYEVDDNGDMVALTWEEAYGGEFPYGDIFVAAYQEAEDGGLQYYGDTFITDPTTCGDDYEMRVDLPEDVDPEIQVYAALDYWGEKVVGTGDPIGYHPSTIELENGDEITGVDITIMATLQGSGSGGCDTISITGDAFLTISYAGGEVGVMLLNMDNEGPMHNWVSWLTPSEETEQGIEGPYENFGACHNDGEAQLVGAWDSNWNDLLDPRDQWGAYVTEPDEEGNPIEVGTTDLAGYDIQIPLGNEGPISLLPFVSLGGEITMDGGGTFDDLGEGARLHVVALKYRPEGDIDLGELEEGYDLVTFEWEDLQGQDTLTYEITSPTNTIAYLWAYADTDADDVLNESGEPVGPAGSHESGRVSTGDTSQDDLHIVLVQNEE